MWASVSHLDDLTQVDELAPVRQTLKEAPRLITGWEMVLERECYEEAIVV